MSECQSEINPVANPCLSIRGLLFFGSRVFRWTYFVIFIFSHILFFQKQWKETKKLPKLTSRHLAGKKECYEYLKEVLVIIL